MKDIRPILKELKKLLEKKDDEIKKTIDKFGNILGKLRKFSLEVPDLGYIDYNGDYRQYVDSEEPSTEKDFREAKLNSLKYVNKLLEGNFPDSLDELRLAYWNSKRSSAFSLIITAQVSGFKVFCGNEDLKQQVEQALAKLNQNQSAQNFLVNAVYVIPTKYKEYRLESQ